MGTYCYAFNASPSAIHRAGSISQGLGNKTRQERQAQPPPCTPAPTPLLGRVNSLALCTTLSVPQKHWWVPAMYFWVYQKGPNLTLTRFYGSNHMAQKHFQAQGLLGQSIPHGTTAPILLNYGSLHPITSRGPLSNLPQITEPAKEVW